MAEGIAQVQPDGQEFVDHPVDLKSSTHKVGVRTPSVQQEAGVVIQVVTVANAGFTSDGTKVAVGDFMYWVNWGPPVASNPHKVRWGTKNMRVTLHAEADLVSAT